MQRQYLLRGLDHFSNEEIEQLWRKRQDHQLFLLIIGISTTRACTYRCNYCYSVGSRATGRKLRLEEQRGVIDQAVELGAKTVLICGDGEPTLDKDLVGIIEHAHRQGLYSVIVTNANTLGNDKVAQAVHGMSARDFAIFLWEHGASLMVKMESLEEDKYEEIVGVKCSYSQFRKACDNIFEAGFDRATVQANGQLLTRMAFVTVVSKLNFFEPCPLRKFAHQHNAQYICKFPSLLGGAELNKKLFFPPWEETTIWLRENYIRKMSDKPETFTTDGIHCGAWHYGVVVGDSGDIRLCYSATCPDKYVIGNIREKPLTELLCKREKTFKELLVRGHSCYIKEIQYQSAADVSSDKQQMVKQYFSHIL